MHGLSIEKPPTAGTGHWDRGRPRPHTMGKQAQFSYKRLLRDFAGEGARGPSKSLEPS